MFVKRERVKLPRQYGCSAITGMHSIRRSLSLRWSAVQTPVCLQFVNTRTIVQLHP